MRRTTLLRAIRVFSALLVFTGALTAPRPARAEVTQRVGTKDVVGGQRPKLSPNGRFVVRFEPTGGPICGTQPSRNNPAVLADIVLYDLETSAAECINVDPVGAGVSGFPSIGFGISADGQLVAFSSSAGTLDPRCGGGGVFLRNRQTRRTECISMTEAGVPANFGGLEPEISANGNVVVFWSSSTNLVEGKTDTDLELFAVRVVAGARRGPIRRVWRPPYGSAAAPALQLSADGRFTTLSSVDPLEPGQVLFRGIVFRYDLETGDSIPVGRSATGEPANNSAGGYALSANGRFAVFCSAATNLVPGVPLQESVPPPVRPCQLFRKDLETGNVVLVSRAWTGGAASTRPGSSMGSPSMSADGRFVVFASDSPDLVPNDNNGSTDVFVADLSTGVSRITRVSVASDGVTESDWDSGEEQISADGAVIVFKSNASNLVPGNPGWGVFVARNPAVFDKTVLTGAGSGGGPHVRGLAIGGAVDPAKTFFAYDATVAGGVTVARGDVDQDGVPDIITGPGPDSPPLVRVFSGARSVIDAAGRLCPIELASFYAYDARFRGGVTVAVADVTGDGIGDIITGAGPGAGPHVRVFQALPASPTGPIAISEYAGFFAYSPAFRGGVRVGAGDLDGNGVSEIVTAAGPGGSPHVQAFVLNAARQLETVLSFYAYNPAFTGGVFVAAGDVDGDGREELITGADAGGSPHVRVFGTGPAFTGLREVHSFFAYERGFTGGVRVAAGDLDGDGAAEIITAPGPWHTPLVRVFHTYANGALGEMSSFYAYDAGFNGGVFVAAPR